MSVRTMAESFASARRLVERGEALLRNVALSSDFLTTGTELLQFQAEMTVWLSEFARLVDNPAYQVLGDPKAVSDVPRAVSKRLWELEATFAAYLEK